MNVENYWKKTLEELKKGKNVVLIVIIERTGSAPNIPGAKMFITHDDSMGTVGGGNSEHKLYERAKSLLKEGRVAVEKVHMEHREDSLEDSSGMICSGSQTFALIVLGENDIPDIGKIIESHVKAQPGVLTINEKGINFDFTDTLATDRNYFEEGTSWTYQENTGIQNRLFCIGGGHVSLALSRIMKTLGFHITVFDDRKDLPTMINNDYAHVKQIVSYEKLPSMIPEGDNIYVTIMTYGHVSDELVLESIIDKKCRYIGMMASSSKKQQIFTSLKEKGISTQLLDTIHTPIGIKIKSHTPEEIAISIAAEIIRIKNA
ncbi:MAG: XdhC family protein [Candidatus Thorarchaeota archaeon]